MSMKTEIFRMPALVYIIPQSNTDFQYQSASSEFICFTLSLLMYCISTDEIRGPVLQSE